MDPATATDPEAASGRPRRRDPRATQARLLAAAREEFAAHGLAGGRIDRIAESAGANKRLLYAYFGNKQEVFGAVVTECVSELNAAVPFTPEDLAEWAGRVLDFFLAHPLAGRVLAWRDIEDAEPSSLEVSSYRQRVSVVDRAQQDGTLDDSLAPIDLIAVVEAVIESWLGATVGLRATAEAPTAARLAENRRAVVDTVRRIVDPAGSDRSRASSDAERHDSG